MARGRGDGPPSRCPARHPTPGTRLQPASRTQPHHPRVALSHVRATDFLLSAMDESFAERVECEIRKLVRKIAPRHAMEEVDSAIRARATERVCSAVSCTLTSVKA